METEATNSITVKSKYVEFLSSFDSDLESAVDIALKRYLIEQVTTRIAVLKRKDEFYRSRYGSDYPEFHRRIAEDEAYVEHVEEKITKLWEMDLADWEFSHKGIEDWTKQQ